MAHRNSLGKYAFKNQFELDISGGFDGLAALILETNYYFSKRANLLAEK